MKNSIVSLVLSGFFLCLAMGDSAHAAFDPYKDCVAKVTLDAQAAQAEASQWRARGGGARAMHCEALALNALAAHDSAAKLLLRLADMEELEGLRQGDMLLQAGHAWLLAGEAERSEGVFSRGLGKTSLETSPLVACDFLIGRAQARSALGHTGDAIADLDTVLEALPAHVEALVFRASLFRLNGESGKASRDLATALVFDPDNAPAYLERGYLYRDGLNAPAARADFSRVMELAPDSEDARKASAALANLGFREEIRDE